MGRKQSIEERKKRSETMKRLYAEGVKMGFRSEAGTKVNRTLTPPSPWKGKKLPFPVWNKGMKTEEYISHYKNGWNKVGLKGDKSPLWRGGITPLRQKIKSTKEWKEWIKAIMKRDGYQCVQCGEKNNQLHVDHIKPYSIIRRESNITTVEQAIECKELWDINNGQVLCLECHKKTDTYLYKMNSILAKV